MYIKNQFTKFLLFFVKTLGETDTRQSLKWRGCYSLYTPLITPATVLKICADCLLSLILVDFLSTKLHPHERTTKQ